MKKIAWILTLFLFTTLSSVTFAAERYQWMTSDDSKGFFFDTRTIEFGKNYYTRKTDFQTVRVWIKTEYTEKGVNERLASREEQGLDNSGFYALSYSLDRYEINSSANTILYLAGADYKENGLVIRSYRTEYIPQSIVPDSVGEMWSKEVFIYAYLHLSDIPAK